MVSGPGGELGDSDRSKCPPGSGKGNSESQQRRGQIRQREHKDTLS